MASEVTNLPNGLRTSVLELTNIKGDEKTADKAVLIVQGAETPSASRIPAAGGNYNRYDRVAGPGSMLLSIARKALYINEGTLADNNWHLVTTN